MSLYDTASTATLTTSPGRAVPRDHQNIAGALLYAWRESPGLCELQPWRGVVLGCEARGPLRLGSVGPRVRLRDAGRASRAGAPNATAPLSDRAAVPLSGKGIGIRGR